MPFIYHSEDKYSIFEESILNVLKYDNIKIACPYVSLDLIKTWIEGKKDWKFLTDFHELVGNIKNNSQRIEFLEFFKNNQNNFRHIEMLHAKVIMSSKSVLFGSANFTDTGLTKRTELSYFTDNLEMLNEINSWFDDLWQQANICPKVDEISALVSIRNQKDETKIKPIEYVKISSQFKPPLKLLYSGKNIHDDIQTLPQNSELKLKLTLQKFDSTFINKFLDRSKELFEYLGINPDDQRFRTSTPKNIRSLLTITIGKNRYALVARHNSTVSLMMPLDFRNKISNNDNKKILFDEETFNSNKKGNPAEAKLVVFKDLDLSDEVFRLWKITCKEEIERNYKVTGRENDHNLYFYKSIIDTLYRQDILKVDSSLED